MAKKLFSNLFKMVVLTAVLHALPCSAINLEEYFPDLKPDLDGRVETVNNEGGMAPSATGAEILLLDDLKYQDTKNLHILEVGPAFGRMPVEVFMQGYKGKYTVIDLSSEHLNYLQKALRKFPNASVQTIAGRFPNDTKILQDGIFDAIVITHVFHFFEPQEFNKALTEVRRLLKNGGKIYLTAKTPYSNRYHKFIPVYEQRVRAKQPNPGYIRNVAEWVDPATISKERLEKLQGRHLYFFSKEDLAKIFRDNKFKIIKCAEIPLGYKSPIWQAPKEYADREDVIVVASKN